MLCSEIWSDAFNRTHVCDQPEGHDTTHVCHCGYEKGEADD